MAGPKADKLTKERRVEAVYRLILDGWTNEQIRQNTSEWRITERQIARYIDEAWQRIEATAAPERAAHLAKAIAAHYQMLRDAKTVKEKALVWAALRQLLGLDAPKAVEVSGKDGGPVVLSWQVEVIDLLKRGELSPDDVRAAYPDLASEFFVKAGVKLESDANGDS